MKSMLMGAALCVAAGAAQAATVTLTISGNPNVSTYTITHDFTSTLDSFVLTVNEAPFVYDFVVDATAPAGGTIASSTQQLRTTSGFGGINADGIQSNVIALEFTDFDAGETASFRADIDDGPFSTVALDYRTILFNNGAAPNATLMASFADGSTANLTLPDGTPGLSSYSFSADIAAVPVPPALPMLALAALSLAYLRRRVV